jgi:hypothetical protein
MKNLKCMRIIAAIAIASACFLAGCQQEEKEEFEEPAQVLDLETEIWINFIFDEANLNSVVSTTFSDGILLLRVEPISSPYPRLKSGKEQTSGNGQPYKKPDSTWTHWGKIGGFTDAGKMYSDMKKFYGNNAYELRVDPARNENGNLAVDKKNQPTGDKDVYHRPVGR